MSALIIRHGNPATLPLDLLLSSIPSLPRAALDRLVERAIDHMDMLDPDPDLEPDGDELDTGNAEDEAFTGTPWGLVGPGCPLSDDDAEHDGDEVEDAL